MAESDKVYVYDEAKNAHEGMTKEQVITAIENMEATGSPGDVDAGFITKIKEMNKQGYIRFWAGTMAEFNALAEKDPETLYLFTDDPTVEDLKDYADDAAGGVSEDLADYKATVNARLDSLGFKEGVAAVSAYGGKVPAVTVNSLKKQGKFVIFNLEWSFSSIVNQTFITFIAIPEEFRPKSGTEPDFAITWNVPGVSSGTIQPHWDSESGTISATIGITLPPGAIADEVKFSILNVGWEID